jgi:Zn-dependent peptidase ImmA (M78 family)
MAKYLTKEQLYFEMHKYKRGLGLDYNDYGFNMLQLCKQDGVMLAQIPFKTKYLRGMASIGTTPDDDVILLNSDRNNKEQNFDCGHEYVHLCIHRNLDQKSFNCLDTIYVTQDAFIEWQANEGAAEIFIPYEVMLPLIKHGHFDINDPIGIMNLKESAADMFNVTKKVIEYRLESLKYEIYQYLNGISLSNIKILSLAQQKRRNINVKSLNDIENMLFDRYLYSIPESKFINFDNIYV